VIQSLCRKRISINVPTLEQPEHRSEAVAVEIKKRVASDLLPLPAGNKKQKAEPQDDKTIVKAIGPITANAL